MRSLLVLAAFAILMGAGVPARADGLRIGASFAALKYKTGNESASLYMLNLSARVARGRAALTFGAPLMGLSGGRVLGTDQPSVTAGPEAMRFGLGDMQVGLEYNLIQNREKMFVLTAGGTMRFATAPTVLGLGTGEDVLGFGLSSYYGLTRQLFLFADLRQAWVGVNVPFTTRNRIAEIGAVYWLTESMGFTVSSMAVDYGGRAPWSLEFNAGLLMEALPGMMMNVGGVGGAIGGAPQAGGTFGFGFEL